MRVTEKHYRCSQCGYITKQKTNHYGATYSFMHYNCCPKCPPHAKYPEFGGITTWECIEPQLLALKDILRSCTMQMMDRYHALAALAYAEKYNLRDFFIRLYLEKRKKWLNWITVTQRNWQSHTKNKNKANHHDSIAIREQYVRCHDNFLEQEQVESFIKMLDPWNRRKVA